MQQEAFDFLQLEKRITEFLRTEKGEEPGRLERWSFSLGLGAAVVTILMGALGSWPYKTAMVVTGLALELAGFALGLGCFVLREWRNSTFAYSGFARDLDRGFEDYQGVVTWLQRFPSHTLNSRLRYMRDRKARFSYRFGLFVGSADRLGVLPLFVVLYIQLKDWSFGDWQALGHVHLVGGLLLWALLLFYMAGWWLSALRERADLYEMLLAEAVVDAPSTNATKGEAT